MPASGGTGRTDEGIHVATTIRDVVLANPRAYEAFKAVIKADRVMRTFAHDHLRATPGMRVLDVGCGTGDIVDYLPEVDYVGVDSNEAYIRKARARHGDKGVFLTLSADEMTTDRLGTFDAVTCLGVLHHLEDSVVQAMFDSLSGLLRPEGRFVAIDPVWHPEQRTLARVLAALDRGRHVRSADGYEQLIGTRFAEVGSRVRHDLLPFPYSHCLSWGEGYGRA